MKTNVKLYVEGGGDSDSLKSDCRRAFRIFLENAGFKGKSPRIVACGPRQAAYKSYCIAVKRNEEAMLLVDSESPVQIPSGDLSEWVPWDHLKARDYWEKPDGANDIDCHLMVQVMETWFLADISALNGYYGNGFSKNVLPKCPIEEVSKDDVANALKAATKKTKKKSYLKGRDSFEIMTNIDPAIVMSSSPWANRFVRLLHIRMSKQMG